jgi:cytochrome b pre-mRNA-processing protein 3
MALSSLFFGKHRKNVAHELYRAAVSQARREEFYLFLEVPDSVDGRFDLLALHVFLLLRRLGKAGRPAKALSQTLFDLMFSDMEANLREMGVSDLAVGGRVKTMAKAFYGRIDAYEPGLASDEDGLAILRDALLRNLYRGAVVADEVLSALAIYVRREDEALARQSFEDIKDGKAQFGSPLLPGAVQP